MEVLDTTIVNVALPHIAGSLVGEQRRGDLGADLLSRRQRHRVDDFRLAQRHARAQALFPDLPDHVHGLLVPVRHGGQPRRARRSSGLLQGFFGGGLQPNQQSIILDSFPPEKRGAAFGVAAIATVVAPILGPTLGGYHHRQFDHGAGSSSSTCRSASSPSFSISSSSRIRPGKRTREPRHRLYRPLADHPRPRLPAGDDGPGRGRRLVQLALHCHDGLAGLSRHRRRASCGCWSPRKPIVHLDVFKDKNFTGGCLMIGAMGAILYASAVIIPQLRPAGSRLYREMVRPHPVAGRRRRHPADPDRRATDELHADAAADRLWLLHHGMRAVLFERARRRISTSGRWS